MKRNFATYIFILFLSLHCFSQIEKSTTQFGVSTLPVFDVLKVFPDNKISGFGVLGNFGYSPIKNLIIGIQPYYGQVSNSYSSTLFGEEIQKLKLYGLNTYLRYYFIAKEKFFAYSLGSIGFGNNQQQTINLSSLALVKNSYTSESVLIEILGAGINYFIIRNLALELNVQYLNMNYLSANLKGDDFHTVLPTVGIQFYLK